MTLTSSHEPSHPGERRPVQEAAEIEDRAFKLELYKAARDARNLEIQLFWQRSNYFLVLSTALAVGFFSRTDPDAYAIVLGLAGVGVAYLWVLVNLGSKYWQSRWETRLREVENELQSGLNLYSAEWDTLDSDVRDSLANSRSSGRLGALYASAVMTKPSVTRLMTTLSASFVVFWVVLVSIALARAS